MLQLLFCGGVFLEEVGYVFEGAVGLFFQQALVGCWGGEGTEVLVVGAEFDVVEDLLVDVAWDIGTAAVPCYFVAGIELLELYGK